ncbi:MAG: hypothetical protein QOJ76_3360 [Acidobacteriota bacterium]|jgi:hypothetical protein|nr:hypothetical protein [Acidobacteriota bacterium]
MKERTYLSAGTRALFRAGARALCAAVAAAVVLCACAAPQAVKEQPPAAVTQPTPVAQTTTPAAQGSPAVAAAPDAQTAADAQPDATPDALPPPPSEVRAALARTYKGAVVFDERGARAVVGDFNGDGSEDLAVEVSPAPGRSVELNDELSNWIVTDPRTVKPPDPRDFDPHQGVQKLPPPGPRPQVEPGDALLVVLHGYQERGWRNPEALQTFLLKSAAGTELRTGRRTDARAAAQKRVPRLFGDVLYERLGNEQGFLYWTGATYGWFH